MRITIAVPLALIDAANELVRCTGRRSRDYPVTRILAALSLLTLTACDPGGPIAARAEWIRATQPQVLPPFCASSCTMGLATACVDRDTILIFHGPQTRDPEAFDRWSAVMARHYPPAIATWFMATGRYGEWTMTGSTAIAWGARGC